MAAPARAAMKSRPRVKPAEAMPPLRPEAPSPMRPASSSNAGRATAEVTVTNTSDHTIWVSSHFPFFEVNRRLVFDRRRAWGMHLDSPAGDTVRWRPGETRTVRLVAYGGRRVVRGFNRLTEGPATPDHVLRTKRLPLVGRDVRGYADTYRRAFAAYAAESGRALAMLDPAPRVILDPELGKGKSCNDYVKPILKTGPHVAGNGVAFYTGAMFPAEYKNRAFLAQRGSWNRTQKTGFRVMMVTLDAQGGVAKYEPFAEGWLQGTQVWGRPVYTQQMKDGSLLITDDYAGAIYRVTYQR